VKFSELIFQLEKLENSTVIDEMEPLSELELKYDFYKKILIVDDDPITPLILEKFLLKEGYYVLTVDNAVEASNIMKKHSLGFVITDVMMPQVNGLEFLSWIKKNFPRTEVGIMTSYSSEEAKKFALDSGAFTFFEKPIELKNLLKIIKEIENRKITSDIIELTLIDFIKMILITNQKKLLSIRDPLIGKTYSLFIENGKILHAEGNDKNGIDAFNDILNTSSGVFFETAWVEPRIKTINKNLSDILDQNKSMSEEEKRKASLNEIFLLKQNLSQYENTISGKLQEDISDKNSSNFDDFTIHEDGIALGITLGSTNREEVVEIMKKFSQFDISSQIKDRIISYDDLSVGIIFNDNDIAIEMTFGNLYKGSTSKGIALGNKLENAIIIYGTPKLSTLNGLVWDHISLFSADGIIISSIRLKVTPTYDKKIQVKSEDFNKSINYPIFNQINQIKEKIIDYTIYPDSLFGITLGRTTRTEIYRIMKELFDLSPTEKNLNNRITYDSLSLTFVLNDLKTTKEIIVGSLFKGSTEKGIKIGDSLQKAFKAYGTPLYFSNTSATWRDMTVFCDKGSLISSIRIHS
ncbi:MAG: response regulator, partial [Candidatus Sericytochromatia bacterium]